MKTLVELELTPAQAADPAAVRKACAERLGWSCGDWQVVPRHRSIDSRRGQPRVHLTVQVYRDEEPALEPPTFREVPSRLRHRVVIVGAGPAGYFAALELLLHGIRPVVLERGKDTQARRYDLRAIMREGRVDPHSNYCFGEGGAGAYSDGKLHTRSGKRGDVGQVLRWLVEHGARSEILVDSHPHLGSDRLPHVVANMRATIQRLGGEVHFGHHVSDLLMQGGRIRAAVVDGVDSFPADALILATGHSARDVYRLLDRLGLSLEAKPFAMGVRIEHPQELIDQIQYRQNPRDPFLPPASYRIARDGVYSFCMCPGGLIVPAATAPGELVVNGMSMSSRNSRWANSGIVTGVSGEDFSEYQSCGPLAGLEFQAALERSAFAANGEGSQKAPAQRLVDFLAGRDPVDLPRSSYHPGLVPWPLGELLPPRLGQALRHGLDRIGRAMRGFCSREAVLVAVESRTSSPVRIPRTAEKHHPMCFNLFPCGEGAGFAGGIVSAALDGQAVARAVALTLSRAGS